MNNSFASAALVGILSASLMASAPAIGGTIMGNGGATAVQQVDQEVQTVIGNVEQTVQTGIQSAHAEIASIQTAIMSNTYVQEVISYAKMVENTILRYKQFATQIQNLVQTVKNAIEAPKKWASMIKNSFSARGMGMTRTAVKNKLDTSYKSDYKAKPVGQPTPLADIAKTSKDTSRNAVEQNAMLLDRWDDESDRIVGMVDRSNEANGALKIQGEANKIAIENVQQVQALRWQQIQESNAARADALFQHEKEEKERETIMKFNGTKFSNSYRPM